jgi:AmpE protein
MKFLVILICLTVNYLWLKDFDRFDDSWFFRLRRRIESALSERSGGAEFSWIVPVVIVYAMPLLVLSIILLAVNGIAFGLPTMLVHILVLLMVFDRTQPGKLASEFLARWRKGDVEGCLLYMRHEQLARSEAVLDSQAQIAAFFKRKLIYRCFEKMFVVFFWYLLTGALGVLFSYVSYQMRDSHEDGQDSRQVNLICRITYILEWLPLRLLALTFSLAGNFVQCFEKVKLSFWEFQPETDSGAALQSYAGCALSGLTVSVSESENSQELSEFPADERERLVEANEIEAIQALLERSQAIWLAILALVTIFGLQMI